MTFALLPTSSIYHPDFHAGEAKVSGFAADRGSSRFICIFLGFF